MAEASCQLSFAAQIQNARVQIQTNFSRLLQNVNALQARLLSELERLEEEDRKQSESEEELRRLTRQLSDDFSSALKSITSRIEQLVVEKRDSLLVLDWDFGTEQTLLNQFCKINVKKLKTESSEVMKILNSLAPTISECYSAHDKYHAIDYPDSCSSNRGDKFGQLSSPRGVAIDNGNNLIYVADTQNNRIQVFNWAARCTNQFSHENMLEPKGICVSEFENRIYITLSMHDMIQSYRKDGTFVREKDYYGSHSFDDPTGITVDDTERVYVCDRRNDKVVVFDKGLHYITVLTKQVSRPRDVKVRGGEVLVLSGDTHSIHSFSRGGRFLREIVFSEEIENAYFFDMDSRDNFLITDSNDNCVKIFDPKGFHVCDVGEKGDGKGTFKYPTGIAVDTEDDSFVVISDRKTTQLQIFVP